MVGNFVLHHASEPEQVLREAFRVLRGGGRVGFTVWSDPAKLEAFGSFFAAVEQHAGAAELPHGPLFGISDFAHFRRLLKSAGFGESSVREVPIAWRTSSIESYLAAFRDWANLDALSPGIRAAVEATVTEKAQTYRSGNAFVVPNPALLCPP